jgi:hypothetical protein
VCGEGSTMCVVNEQVVLELLNGLNLSDLPRLLELFIDLVTLTLLGVVLQIPYVVLSCKCLKVNDAE